MTIRSRLLALGALASLAAAAPSQAQLFWNPPDFSGAPVRGDEAGLGLPLPGATPAELDAALVWNMRAGLNVAALQCQFAPTLMTVHNYNDLLRAHGAELGGAYKTLGNYFRRTGGKKASVASSQNALDQFTTRTYNGFSTLQAQRGFCQTAGSIGREAIGREKGAFLVTARTRMREFRNSLQPAGDRIALSAPLALVMLPGKADPCWDDRHDRAKKNCA